MQIKYTCPYCSTEYKHAFQHYDNGYAMYFCDGDKRVNTRSKYCGKPFIINVEVHHTVKVFAIDPREQSKGEVVE